MENKRIRLLMQPSDYQGVGSFRNIWPSQSIQKNFVNDFDVEIGVDIDFNNIDYLSKFDIIHFHRQMGEFEKFPELSKKLREKGVVLIMDIDDYWDPATTHPLYEVVKNDKLCEKILSNIKNVDCVTTTTEIFRKHILKYNPYVHVIPNALDMEHKMWKSEIQENKSGKCRISIICGSSHYHDLILLKDSMNKLNSSQEMRDKYQLILCGFDIRGTKTEIRPDNSRNTINIQPHESIWNDFERIFTSNYSLIKNKEYVEYLKKIRKEDFPGFEMENYIRRWTLPLTQYGKHYDYCDVCLAPLAITEKYKELQSGEIVAYDENDRRIGTIKTRSHTFNEAKCIVGDSLISTNIGFLNIKNIVENKTKCLTEINGHQNIVTNYFKYDNMDTIKITTNKGYEIEGTPHHKIQINKRWIELKDLKINDDIELTCPEFLQKNYQQISFPMLLTKNMTEEKIKNCDEDMIPKITINEKWGRFLGYMLGDGNYGGSSLVRISCDKRYTDVVDDVLFLYRSMGLNPTIVNKTPDKRCKNSLAKEGFGVDLVSTCITFLKIAKKYNLCGTKGKTFRIPDIILQSPKSVIKEFLRGLFESDGTVESCGLSLCSKDLKLIQQVQCILLGFNITSLIYYSYNKHYNKYYYVLRLGRNASEIFYKEINFVSKAKKEKLKIIIKKPHSNAFKIQSFKDKITKIEFGKNTVYDVEVENVHSYNANGIINHNSELKIIESGMKKKALIAQDFGIYKELLRDGKNAILIPTSNNKDGWYKAIKELILNPDLRETLANNLHEFVKDRYELKTVTDKRVDFYKKILIEKEMGVLDEYSKKRANMNEKPIQLSNVFDSGQLKNFSISSGGSKSDEYKRTLDAVLRTPSSMFTKIP